MRAISLLKVLSLAGAVALASSVPSISFAAKLPAGACAVHKKVLANGAICSYDCNATNGWCSQQACLNGALQQIINCYGTFCSAKCG